MRMKFTWLASVVLILPTTSAQSHDVLADLVLQMQHVEKAPDRPPAPTKPPADPTDPFGPPVKIPSDIKKDDPATPAAGDDEQAANKPPRDPELIALRLQNGSIVEGKFAVKQLTIDTQFGPLTVPITKIRSFRPGLSSQPREEQRIEGMIENLGADSYNDREQAQKDLTIEGIRVREELKRHLDDGNAERTRRIKAILAAIESMQDEMLDGQEPPVPLARHDTLQTAKFTVTGKITPREFDFHSKYGVLHVSLGNIRSAERDTGEEKDVSKGIKVNAGQHIVQRGYKNSGIRVEKGDLISIRATGTMTMTGRNYRSTPNGMTNMGTYISGIYGGTLIARVGGSGSFFKVGTGKTFPAPSSGVLVFAIAMRDSYARSSSYQFLGDYNVRIKVKRK